MNKTLEKRALSASDGLKKAVIDLVKGEKWLSSTIAEIRAEVTRREGARPPFETVQWFRAARMAELLFLGEPVPAVAIRTGATLYRDVADALMRIDTNLPVVAAMELAHTIPRAEPAAPVAPVESPALVDTKIKPTELPPRVKRAVDAKPTGVSWPVVAPTPSPPGDVEPLLAFLEERLVLSPRDPKLLAAMVTALRLGGVKP